MVLAFGVAERGPGDGRDVTGVADRFVLDGPETS